MDQQVLRRYGRLHLTQTSADTIQGTITYTTKTNGNPDCAAVECSASQRFSGSRPPK